MIKVGVKLLLSLLTAFFMHSCMDVQPTADITAVHPHGSAGQRIELWVADVEPWLEYLHDSITVDHPVYYGTYYLDDIWQDPTGGGCLIIHQEFLPTGKKIDHKEGDFKPGKIIANDQK